MDISTTHDPKCCFVCVEISETDISHIFFNNYSSENFFRHADHFILWVLNESELPRSAMFVRVKSARVG